MYIFNFEQKSFVLYETLPFFVNGVSDKDERVQDENDQGARTIFKQVL